MTNRVKYLAAATIAVLLVGVAAEAAQYLARVEYGVRFVPAAALPDNCTSGRTCVAVDNAAAPNLRYYDGTTNHYVSRGSQQTIAAAATISLDHALGSHVLITLSATAITTVNAAAGQPGAVMIVEVIQDGTGGRSIGGWSSSFVFAGGSYTATATANKRDSLTFAWNSTASKWYETARAMNL